MLLRTLIKKLATLVSADALVVCTEPIMNNSHYGTRSQFKEALTRSGMMDNEYEGLALSARGAECIAMMLGDAWFALVFIGQRREHILNGADVSEIKMHYEEAAAIGLGEVKPPACGSALNIKAIMRMLMTYRLPGDTLTIYGDKLYPLRSIIGLVNRGHVFPIDEVHNVQIKSTHGGFTISHNGLVIIRTLTQQEEYAVRCHCYRYSASQPYGMDMHALKELNSSDIPALVKRHWDGRPDPGCQVIRRPGISSDVPTHAYRTTRQSSQSPHTFNMGTGTGTGTGALEMMTDANASIELIDLSEYRKKHKDNDDDDQMLLD